MASPDGTDRPPVSEQTLELLKDLQQAVLDQDSARIVKKCAPALLFEDRLDATHDAAVLFAIFDIYFKNLLIEGEYESVVQLLTHHAGKSSAKRQAPPGGNNSNNRHVPAAIAKRLEPARLYAMYRLERYEAVTIAVDTALESNDDDVDLERQQMLQHIQAQTYYKLQDYRFATNLYSSLLKSLEAEEQDSDSRSNRLETMQLLNNLIAIPTAHMLPYSRDDDSVLESFRSQIQELLDDQDLAGDKQADMAYNLATFDLCTDGHNNKEPGHSMLNEALETVRATGQADGLSDEEIAKDLAPMKWNLEWSRLFWQGTSSTSTTTPTKHASMATRMVALANQALKTGEAMGSGGDAVRLLPKTNAKLFTPFQNNLLYYNRAVLQYRARQFDDCRQTCEEWASCLSVSSSSSSSGKKKPNGGSTDSKKKMVLAFSSLESNWWGCRIAVLEALCIFSNNATSNGNGQSATDLALKLINEQLEQVQHLPQSSSENTSSIKDQLVLYLMVHSAKIENPNMSLEQTVDLLQSLPGPLQQEKAVIASMASLYHQMGKDQEAHSILKDSGNEEALADFLLSQGRYQEVANLLENRDDPISRARYVKAMSYIDPAKTHEVWLEVEPELVLEDEEEEADGAELEVRELPRLKSSHKTRKDALAVASNSTSKSKKSRESILRQRARKREAYLAELEQQGRSTTTTPDPERWLPKYERSYNRRRRNRQQHKGAQGGVAERDAAKLDVAARKAARESGNAIEDRQSTAHMAAVSSGGPRKGGRRRN